MLGNFKIQLSKFNPYYLSKCFILCKSFTEHAWKQLKRVLWTRLNVANVFSEHAWAVLHVFSKCAWEQEHFQQCSVNTVENFQACSRNMHTVVQVCSGNMCTIVQACSGKMRKIIQICSKNRFATAHHLGNKNIGYKMQSKSETLYTCLRNSQACSGNTLKCFPSVLSETFVNYKGFFQMRIKILNWNIKVPRQKKNCKTISGQSKILIIIEDDEKCQNISCQSPFILGCLLFRIFTLYLSLFMCFSPCITIYYSLRCTVHISLTIGCLSLGTVPVPSQAKKILTESLLPIRQPAMRRQEPNTNRMTAYRTAFQGTVTGCRANCAGTKSSWLSGNNNERAD